MLFTKINNCSNGGCTCKHDIYLGDRQEIGHFLKCNLFLRAFYYDGQCCLKLFIYFNQIILHTSESLKFIKKS